MPNLPLCYSRRTVPMFLRNIVSCYTCFTCAVQKFPGLRGAWHSRTLVIIGVGGGGGWSPPNIFLEGAEPPQYFRPDYC